MNRAIMARAIEKLKSALNQSPKIFDSYVIHINSFFICHGPKSKREKKTTWNAMT